MALVWSCLLRSYWLSVCLLTAKLKLFVQSCSRQSSPRAAEGKQANIFSIKHDPVSPKSLNKVIKVGYYFVQQSVQIQSRATLHGSIIKQTNSLDEKSIYTQERKTRLLQFLEIFQKVTNSTIKSKALFLPLSGLILKQVRCGARHEKNKSQNSHFDLMETPWPV